ncbi:MAG: DUF1003 domain-containing protein [Bacteroidota bacterium]
MQTFTSDLSGKEFPVEEKLTGYNIRKAIFNLIQTDHPDFSEQHSLSVSELNSYHDKYTAAFLLREAGDITQLEQNVIDSIMNQTLISENADRDESTNYTIGQKIADSVASFGGSWKFIILFGIFILIWISINVVFLASKGFDPYPFILLNLILSCLAALQAPVIMMSQNRQEEKDRERSKKDYMVNLKSELEIRVLHEKMDHLILYQHQNIMNLQMEQNKKLEEIMQKIEEKK